MKKYDLIYYWQNYLINQDNIYIKPDAYVLKFSLVNSYSRDFLCNWYSFKSEQELIGFIKFVVIPSSYITKAFGREEDTIFLDALDDYETIDLIEDAECHEKYEVLRQIRNDYEMINNLKKNFTVEKFKKFINITNGRSNTTFGIFSRLEFFENVKQIGKELIKEFEDDNMLEELENHMELKKNQILALFDGIDKNPFMLKRLGTYLSNTLAF
ncbi:hypothetical protein ABFP60_06165 [Clostridioides difficile]